MPPVGKLARIGATIACLFLASLSAAPNLYTYLNVIDADQLRNKRSDLRRARYIHPRSTAIGIELALALESQGNLVEAEHELLAVAQYNRQYLPAWTLANFYFRHGQEGKFWPWATRAAGLCFDDFRPLLRLAHSFEPDPPTAAKRLGARPELLRQFLDELIGEARFAQAAQIAELLQRNDNPDDALRLREFQRRLAEHRQALRKF